MLKRFSILCITIVYTTTLWCQYDDLKAAVCLNYGEMNAPFTWEKQMVGKLDNIYVVNLYLVTDTESYQGAYQIKDSKDIKYLEGGYDGEVVRLYEYDENGTLTGSIAGDLNDYIFYGTWSDRINSEESSFVMYEQNYTINEDQNSNWVRSFENNNNHAILIKTNDEYKIKCHLTSHSFSANVDCIDDDCSSFKTMDISITEFDSKVVYLSLTSDSIHIKYQDTIAESIPLTNLIRLRYDHKPTVSQQSYETSIDFSNKRLSKAWSQFVLENINSNVTNDEGLASSMDIISDYLSKNCYSGIIRYQDNQSDRLIEKGFIIDFKKNKVETPASLFKKGFSLKKYIDIEFANIKEDLDNPDLTAEDFNIISIVTNGLLIRSNMNLIYGQSELIIPYDVLPFKILK